MGKEIFQTAFDLIQERYGVRCQEYFNPITNQVDIAPTKIFSNNPRRIGSIVVNLSANSIYVAFSNQVSAAYGIWLAPNGGSYVLMIKDDFTLCTMEMWGMSSVDNQAIFTISIELR